MKKEPDFTKIEKVAYDISCMVLKPILIYIERNYSREMLKKFTNETGLDTEFLENEDNWISFEYYKLFLEKLVLFTNNPNAPYETGLYFTTKESYGFFYYLLNVIKLFSTPELAYKKIAEYSSMYSKIGKFEYLYSERSKVVMKSIIFPHHVQSKLNCDVIKGQLAAIPRVWNLPLAKINEIQCQAEGADSCIYEIVYISRSILKNILLISATFLALALEFVSMLLLRQTIISLKELVITILVSCILFMFVNRPQGDDNKVSEDLQEERTNALEKAIYESKKDYHELQKANELIREEAEKLSILKDIAEEINTLENEKETIEAVINIIMERVGFDRGYCLVFNNQYELYKEPVFLCREILKNDPVSFNYKPAQWKEMFAGMALEMNITIGKFKLINPDPVNYESLVMHLIIRNTYLYFLVFDSPYSRIKINPDYSQFFITITNQLKIALNKIFASNTAKTIISTIPSSIAVFDLENYRISFYNESFKKEILHDREDQIGHEILDAIGVYNSDFREKFLEQISQLPQRNLLDDQELLTEKDVLGYTLFLLPEFSGKKKEAGIIMKNITSQKEMKEQLFRAEKMAALGTLVSGVAHEINNPLYGILGNAEIIRDEAESQDIKDYASTIIDFTVHASDIVKDLSSYSRSMREEKPAKINLNDIIEEALRIVKYSKNFININIDKDLREVPPIFALGGELRQIYINLFNNAVDAMKGKGVLSIKTSFSGNTILTSIGDTGSGIPAENLSKIFDPFFTTKDTGQGTGLGLSIVYRLVTKYDGIISVRSLKDAGTVFDIKFIIKEI